MSTTKQPRLLKTDRSHFARVQAAVIGSFNFWGKPKANPQYVRRMASDIARDAVADWHELSKRTSRNGSSK